jgi:hypothetical protein
MSTNRGIFESFPNQSASRQDSPFSAFNEPSAESANPQASPFTAVGKQDSPFTVVDELADGKAGDAGKGSKIPERRKLDSPFQIAEPSEGFGFEAVPPPASSNPFEPAPASSASPFTVAEPKRPAISPTQAAIAAFTTWQDPNAPAAAAAPAALALPEVKSGDTSGLEAAAPAQIPSVFAAAPEAAPVVKEPSPTPAAATSTPAAPVTLTVTPTMTPAPQSPSVDEHQSDSFNIRQLELRAIFGVDRELSAEEILQRARSLPGMRNVARLGASEIAAIDAVKDLLPGLGFGSGTLKLYSGAVPLEFIREGSVLLAVQTDGGFAPGVRETLMIVARELGRMA